MSHLSLQLCEAQCFQVQPSGKGMYMEEGSREGRDGLWEMYEGDGRSSLTPPARYSLPQRVREGRDGDGRSAQCPFSSRCEGGGKGMELQGRRGGSIFHLLILSTRECLDCCEQWVGCALIVLDLAFGCLAIMKVMPKWVTGSGPDIGHNARW